MDFLNHTVWWRKYKIEKKATSSYQRKNVLILVVSYPEGQKTVPSESITQIPFENQCRSALSTLIRTAEKARSQYHYVNFPFGLMDTKGLKDLLAFNDHCNALKRTLEEKKWLNTKASVPHHNMCIKESNLLSSLSTDQITCSKPSRHSMAYRCQCGVHGQPYQLNN